MADARDPDFNAIMAGSHKTLQNIGAQESRSMWEGMSILGQLPSGPQKATIGRARMSDGKAMSDERISNDHKSPF